MEAVYRCYLRSTEHWFDQCIPRWLSSHVFHRICPVFSRCPCTNLRVQGLDSSLATERNCTGIVIHGQEQLCEKGEDQSVALELA